MSLFLRGKSKSCPRFVFVMLMVMIMIMSYGCNTGSESGNTTAGIDDKSISSKSSSGIEFHLAPSNLKASVTSRSLPEVPNNINISGISISYSRQPVQTGDSVNVAVKASSVDSRPVYYKFYYCGNYGTADYSTTAWTTVQDYSTSNSCQYTFPNNGSYVIVARAVTDPQNEPSALPIIGGVITVGGNGNQVNISSYDSPSPTNIEAGGSTAVSANAATSSGAPVYYKFYYCGNYGTSLYDSTPWTTVQEYSTSSTCNYSFPSAGNYISVVRAVTDPANEPAALTIIGGVVSVRNQGDDTEAPTVPTGLSVTTDSPTMANLNWMPSTDNIAVTGYRIYRNNTLVSVSSTNSFTDTGLNASTEYCYKVASIDASGNESEKTTPTCVTTNTSDSGRSRSCTISGTAILSGGNPVEGGRVELYGSNGNLIKAMDNATDSNGNYAISFEPSDEDLQNNPYRVIHVIKNGRFLRSVIIGFTGQASYTGEDCNISEFTEAAIILSEATGDKDFSEYSSFLKSYNQNFFNMNDKASYEYPFRKILGNLAYEIVLYASGSTSKPTRERARELILTFNNYVSSNDLMPADPNITESRLVFISEDLSTLVTVNYNPNQAQAPSLSRVKITTRNVNDGSLQMRIGEVDFGGLWLGNDATLSAESIDSSGLNSISGRIASQKDVNTKTGKRLPNNIFVLSNLLNFIDIDQSGFEYEGKNSENKDYGVFKIGIKSPLNIGNLSLTINFNGNDNTSFYNTVRFSSASNTSVKSSTILIDTHLNQQITATIKYVFDSIGPIDLFVLEDVIDKLIFKHEGSVVSYKKLKETRADASSFDNNYEFSNEGWKKDGQISIKGKNWMGREVDAVTAGNTLTHRIVDFDALLEANLSGAEAINEIWNKSDYALSGNKGNNGRIPLLLIHGWQGNIGLRSPAKLGLWENSEIEYFHNILNFYLKSKAMQEKYHVYLYHYPTYKHVYYNARILKELFASLPSTSDLARGLSGGGVSIIAHSMGGLVARSATEEHNVFGPNAEKLLKLVTLDTPHHGSPLAVPNWLTENSITNSVTKKDVQTHGALDLQWDSFDGIINIGPPAAKVTTITNCYYVRYPLNTFSFDMAYLSTEATFNPWLLNLNVKMQTQGDKYKDKYVIYTAWVADSTADSDEGQDIFDNDLAMVVASSVIELTGYAAGGAEPVGSSLLAPIGTPVGSAFNPEKYSVPTRTTYLGSYFSYYPNYSLFDIDIPAVIASEGQAHPLGFKFRIFWDYDHDKILKGDLSDLYLDLEINKNYFKLEASVLNVSFMPVSLYYMFMNMADDQQKTYGDSFKSASYENNLVEDPLFMMLKNDLIDRPTINEIIPNHAFRCTEITINGTGFSKIASENYVSFEGESFSCNATVSYATPNSLVVKIPYSVPSGNIKIRAFREKNCGNSVDFTIRAIRYHDNGDGTVTDLKTGLIWKKYLETHLDDHERPTTVFTWFEAMALGNGVWRVPSKDELDSLRATCDEEFLNLSSVLPPNGWKSWSSTTYADDSMKAWYVIFDEHTITLGYASDIDDLVTYKASDGYFSGVRLVRNAQ